MLSVERPSALYIERTADKKLSLVLGPRQLYL